MCSSYIYENNVKILQNTKEKQNYNKIKVKVIKKLNNFKYYKQNCLLIRLQRESEATYALIKLNKV